MRRFLRALWTRCLVEAGYRVQELWRRYLVKISYRVEVLWTRCLVEASYRVQGSWDILPVPLAAFAIIAGLAACAFFGINYWILFASGLLSFCFLTYLILQTLLAVDNASLRMGLVRKILKMKSGWILKERNAEIRKRIIENLGWPKILSDLHGELVDGWNKYELYRIQPKDRLMHEPFLLLKMKCPSTGSDYTLCVPPNMKTAKGAITWVRKDIAPEEFIKQT